MEDGRALEDEVARVAGVRNAADARLVELVAEALASGVWRGERLHTPEQWLMWRCGLERSTAHRIVRVARRAGELPQTMRRFGEGRLSLDQAAAVARHAPAAYEDSVSRVATHATVAQITRATRRYGFDAEAPPAAPSPALAPAPDEREERHVAFGTDERGWWARLRLPVDEGATVEAALLAARQRLHRADPEARPSWADAVVALVSAGERPPPAHAVVHLEARTGGPGWVAGLGGTSAPLPDALRRTLTCDADAELVRLVDGRPVDAGRRQRLVPERLRRLVVHRDGGTCRVPGCDRRLWLHVHHVVHWEDGGPTDLANLCLLCPAHHRRHHRGLLGIVAAGPEGADGELAFTDERGHRLDPSGRARPPGLGDAPAVGPYAHPAGEPLRSRWVHFQRSVDPHPDAA